MTAGWRRIEAGLYERADKTMRIIREEWSNVGIRGGTGIAWTIQKRDEVDTRKWIDGQSFSTLYEAKRWAATVY